MTLFRALTILSLLLLQPALAVDSVWVEKEPARWRLIAATHDGKPYAALEVQLSPGWHTYWRFPGASGIAPEFDFTESVSVSAASAVYPAPYFFDDGVGGYFGYEVNAGFVFPLKLQDDEATLNFTGLIGVCREICIPIDLEAGLMVDMKALQASPHASKIAAMLAAQPQAPGGKLAIGGISFDGVSLQVVVTGEDLQAPQVMIVPGPHDIIGPPRAAARHPASFLIEVPAWSKLDHPLIGRKLNLIVRDGARAIEADIEVTDHRLMPAVTPN